MVPRKRKPSPRRFRRPPPGAIPSPEIPMPPKRVLRRHRPRRTDWQRRMRGKRILDRRFRGLRIRGRPPRERWPPPEWPGNPHPPRPRFPRSCQPPYRFPHPFRRRLPLLRFRRPGRWQNSLRFWIRTAIPLLTRWKSGIPSRSFEIRTRTNSFCIPKPEASTSGRPLPRLDIFQRRRSSGRPSGSRFHERRSRKLRFASTPPRLPNSG